MTANERTSFQADFIIPLCLNSFQFMDAVSSVIAIEGSEKHLYFAYSVIEVLSGGVKS